MQSIRQGRYSRQENGEFQEEIALILYPLAFGRALKSPQASQPRQKREKIPEGLGGKSKCEIYPFKIGK